MWQLARVMGLALACAILLLAAANCGGKKSRTTPTIIPVGSPSVEAAAPQDGGSSEPNTDFLMKRLTAALEQALAARGGKVAMAAPTGEGNLIVGLDYWTLGSSDRLHWRYRNLGDYNQDGTVNIADITPLARHFGETLADDPLAEVIDGDLDGMAGIGDVTALAMRFQSTVEAYVVESAAEQGGEYAEIGSVEFAGATGGEDGWKAFVFPLPTGEAVWYRVVPVDSEGNRGLASLPVQFQPPNPAPRVLSVSPRWGEQNTVAQFTAAVEGEEPFSYIWSFSYMGDPSVSAEASPHVFLQELGWHICHVTVSNAYGERKFYFAVLVVPVEYPPFIERIWPLQATANTVTQFFAQASGTEPLEWHWNFGGGAAPNESDEAWPRVLVDDEGTYECSLTVSNSVGVDSYGFVLEVTSEVYPPKIERVWPTSVEANTPVQFFAQASGTEPLEWHWNFGGGADPNESSEAWPEVVAGDEGAYECSLTIANDAGIDSFGFMLEVTPGARGDWWMFGREPMHNRRSEYAGPDEGGIAWSYHVPSSSPNAITTGAAFDRDGTIYFGCEDGFIYAVYSDGSLKWRYETGGPVYSSPAISKDGVLYAGSYDGSLYAIDLEGNLLWQYETGDKIASSPAIGSDGTVYVGSYDHFLYAINPDGTLKWRYEADDAISSSPAIGASGTICVGSYDHYLYAIDPSGTLVWSYGTGSSIYSSPAITADGTIYIGNEDGYLFALNPDGTRKWYYDTDETVYSSPALGADSTVYFANDSGTIYAIGPERDIQWAFPTGGQIRSSLAVDADGTVYAASYDDYLYALNPDGSVRWRCKTNSQYSSIAIGSDGLVYVGSTDGFMYGVGEGASSPYIVGVEPSRIRPGEESQFSAEVLGSEPLEYSWDFGAGTIPSTSSEPSPVVLGGEDGYYEGTLSVASPLGDHSLSFTYVVTPWSIEVVDDTSLSEPQPCLAFDSEGNPAISYHFSSRREWFTSSPENELRFAIREFSGWTITTLDKGYCTGYQSSMALGPEGNLAISYIGQTADPERPNLRYAIHDSSSWMLSVVFEEGCSGYFSSLVFDPNGNPTISFSGSGEPPHSFYTPLCFARWDGSSWQTEVIDTGREGVIYHTSLAYDAQGNPCIAWGDPNDGDLFFTQRSGDSWNTDIVHDGIRCDFYPISLVMDTSGSPIIAFLRSSSPRGPTVARKTDGSWNLEPVGPSYPWVSGICMALDSDGNPAISHLQPWTDTYLLTLARWNGSSWDLEFVDTANSWRTSLAFDLEGNPCIAYTDYAESSGSDPVYEVRFARYVP